MDPSVRCGLAGVGRPILVATVALVAVAGCGLEKPSNIQTTAVRHTETGLPATGADLASSAVDYVMSFGSELELSSATDFETTQVVLGKDGLRHVRLQQRYRGVPVRGSEVVVHADSSTFFGYRGTVTRNLDDVDVEPTVTAEQAVLAAKRDRATTAGVDADAIVYSEGGVSELVIQPRTSDGVDLAWHVELLNPGQLGVPPGRWIYLIAASDGAILDRFDSLNTIEAQASGPGGNARVARTWTEQLDVEGEGDEYAMVSDSFMTFDFGDETDDEHRPVTRPLDGFDDPVINDVHGLTEIALEMMREWVGHSSLAPDGYLVGSFAHTTEGGETYANAYWNGSGVYYGDGDGRTLPFGSAIDVIGHELAHGFTQFHSDLIYRHQSGGLNESFSDIAGTMAEFYAEGDDADLVLGEDIMVDGGAFREMCNQSVDGVSFEDATSVDDRSAPHFTSGVPNKAFCLAVARFATRHSVTESVRRVGQAWFGANQSYWNSSTTFVQGCDGVIDAARGLGFSEQEVADLRHSWEDVGVACGSEPPTCDEDAICEVEQGETCASCSRACGPCNAECGIFERLKCGLGLADCSHCGGDPDRSCGDGVCSGDENDLDCPEDCGCAAAGLCGSVAPYGCYCDATCSDTGDCCADVDSVCPP